MDCLLGSKSLPPGFRFHPTDEELFLYYLKRKVMGKSLRPHMIAEVDVYRFDPWDLPDKSCLKTRDVVWYFFCPRSKKYANGARTNRSTEHGYWKSTGNDRTVKYKNRPVGKIKTLIFHQGKAPNGDRTDWVMHEYRLDDKVLADQGVPQDAFVISKVYKKSGLGPKNGEHYGAPFVEEEWESDDDDNDDNLENVSGLVVHPEGPGGVAVIPDTPSFAAPAPSLVPTANPLSTAIVSNTLAATPSPSAAVEDDNELENLLAMFGDEDVCPLDEAFPVDDIFIGLDDFMELNDLI